MQAMSASTRPRHQMKVPAVAEAAAGVAAVVVVVVKSRHLPHPRAVVSFRARTCERVHLLDDKKR